MYIDQKVTWYQFYLNESVARLEGVTSIITMLQADRPICKESRFVFPSPENKMPVILTKNR